MGSTRPISSEYCKNTCVFSRKIFYKIIFLNLKLLWMSSIYIFKRNFFEISFILKKRITSIYNLDQKLSALYQPKKDPKNTVRVN